MKGFICALALAAPLAAPFSAPVRADDVGAYLAGRSAAVHSDFEAAARYYMSALASDQGNAGLARDTLTALVELGDFAAAEPLARGPAAQEGLAALVRHVRLAEQGDWQGILDDLPAGDAGLGMVEQLARAWALAGDGRMRDALDAFDAMAAVEEQRPFALYNKALALSLAGDLEGAEALFSLPPEQGMPVTRRAVLAHAILLGQLGRGGEGADLLEERLGLDMALAPLAEDLRAGRPVPPTVPDARAGLAGVYFALADWMSTLDRFDLRQLVYARAALWLTPQDLEAMLLAADSYEILGRPDLGIALLSGVGPASPAFAASQKAMAALMRRSGDAAGAAEVLQALLADNPDQADLQAALGDTLRALGRYPEAEAAYDQALLLYPGDAPVRWHLHYTRAIARQEAGNWPGAEDDLRRALELQPGEPRVLNRLGYSLVLRGEALDEALGMVQRAVEAEPQNAAIIDSLGWALFSLGRLDEAVPQLERAAELSAANPEINEHLGDAYWRVGRREEARVQWQRALSFGPEAPAPARLQAKLEDGMAPAEVASGG
ncbi:tetratricopeptide repeat protein [Pseudoroseicyclus sp. H15]